MTDLAENEHNLWQSSQLIQIPNWYIYTAFLVWNCFITG